MTIPANTREAPMESDRELLELAARAAGIEGAYFHSDNPIHCGIYQARGEYYWNPLISDSEAFRLAVNLRISINQNDCDCCVWAWPRDDRGNPNAEEVSERLHAVDAPAESQQDRATATRRCVVRLAAAIARSQHE